MAAAAVLPPSASGLSTPSEVQYTDTLDTTKMAPQVTPIQPQTFLAKKMATILKDLSYDTSSINTLITRAESNTIEASGISLEDLLDESSIKHFIETDLLNEKSLRERSIYLNSNEPLLLFGYSGSLDLSVQQIRGLKDRVLSVLRDRGIKPVRVYVRETDVDSDGENVGLSFSLLNVVNSDIGVNMVSLLDQAFYGGSWKEELVAKEGWNGYDLIWRDEAWKDVKQEEAVGEVEVSDEVEEAVDAADAADVADDVVNDATEAEVIQQEPIETGSAGAELQPMPSAPVRSVSYKSADDVPEDTDEEEPEPVQHPALKELLERDAQRPPVQHPTWARSHDSEAYLDIIKTHSRGQDESEPNSSTVSRPADEKDDFEVVDKP